MNDARISVIVPNYNHGRLLPRCLTALLNQSLPPWEIIVVDDGSTDNSLEVLKSFAQRYDKVRVLSNERNSGVAVTLNRGLRQARCDYVFFGAADDEVRPELFERSICILQAHPKAGLCSGICEWRCSSTGLTWQMGAGMPRQACYLSPGEMVALARNGRLAISAQATVFRKSALVEAGAWIPELRWFCDFFGAYVVGFRHGMCHVPEVLATFNLHPTGYYHSAHSSAERREVMDRILRFLEGETYADVAPLICQSGLLGTLGWPMFCLVLSHREHWGFLNGPFVRRVARRCAEVVGRRFFPNWLARLCLKAFYGPR